MVFSDFVVFISFGLVLAVNLAGFAEGYSDHGCEKLNRYHYHFKREHLLYFGEEFGCLAKHLLTRD